jgi:hypothetical protein
MANFHNRTEINTQRHLREKQRKTIVLANSRRGTLTVVPSLGDALILSFGEHPTSETYSGR